VDFSSYISGDFLSAGVTSTATQTNSYTFRLRQAWGQAKFDNGWKFLGGQMWSLVTENKAGIAPSDDLGRTNDARPSTIDPGYNVGFSFARQYGIRLTKDFGDKVAIAVRDGERAGHARHARKREISCSSKRAPAIPTTLAPPTRIQSVARSHRQNRL
jgi:hypothetical protein